MIALVIVFLILMGVTVVCIGGCIAIFFICCALPASHIFNIFSKRSPRFYNNATNSNFSHYNYSELSTNNSYYANSSISPSAPPMLAENSEQYQQEELAYAYIIPPLIAANHSPTTITTTAPIAAIVDMNTEGGQSQPILHDSESNGISNNSGGFKDIWAAILFIVNVLIIAILAFHTMYTFAIDKSQIYDTYHNNKQVYNVLNMILLSIAVSCVLSIFLGSSLLSYLMKHSEKIIENVMWSNIYLYGFISILSLISLNLFAALMFGLITVFSYWYYTSVKIRIPFASSVLSIACKSFLYNNNAILLTAFSFFITQLVWMAIWASASFTVWKYFDANNNNNNSNNNNNGDNSDDNNIPVGISFLLFLSLYWGLELLRVVVITTVSGSVACWWFQPKRPAPVRGSLFRALVGCCY